MSDTSSRPEIRFSDTVSAVHEDYIMVLTLDHAPVNAVSADMRRGLAAAIGYLQTTEAVRAAIITGAGKTFVGGADITEFGKAPIEPILPTIVEMIETSSKPVIAAINGAALGGGAEIALACHHRIATRGALIGFPEVKLGLVPGAGGTQRLPRLTGVAIAIDLIGSGRLIKAAEAHVLGIIDGVTEENVALAAMKAASSPETVFRQTSLLSVPPAIAETVIAAALKIEVRARGQKAPLEAIRLVCSTAERTFSDGLLDERTTFLLLKDSPEAAALRHVFFAERAAAKIAGLEGVRPRAISTVGIVGLGLMGSGIAIAALDAGFSVLGIDQTAEAAGKGRDRIEAQLTRNVTAGRIDQSGLQERLARLVTSAEMVDLANADLIIEAVFDDIGVKSELFSRLDRIARPDAILATNTSYLNPDVIAQATGRPERVLGLHFFSPANIMRLVEVVRCATTDAEVLASGFSFARKLGKLPILSGVTEGFIGNRIFSAYRRGCEVLLEDGALPEEIDAAMESYGFAMGPFAVFDLAGLEIAWARRKREASTRDPATRYVEIADRLCEAGRFGQKTGKGWYRYDAGKKSVDPEVTSVIDNARTAKGIVSRAVTEREIVDRLLAAMADEGRKLLAEGIASRSSDIDLVMINGYGFPAHKGGPMFAAGIR